MEGVELLAGDVVADRYHLLRRLGEGGAGVVWYARDGARSIHVALKVLKSAQVLKDDMRARFDQEAELSARMLSPHIVKIFSTGMTREGAPFIVYEHLEGVDLGVELRSRATLPLADVKTIVVHVARALARAHSVGVLHRDVKPENIFLTKDADGRPLVKVLDFGVAELIRSPAQEIAGTIEYIAPEVLLGERPADIRTDLYALAAVAYECCTGKPPFPADNVGQLVLALTTKTLAPTGIDGKLDAWFERALARDPDARWTSAKELAEALHGAIRHLEPARGRQSAPVIPAVPVAPAPAPELPPMRPRMASFVFDEHELGTGELPPPASGFKDARAAVRSASYAKIRAVRPEALDDDDVESTDAMIVGIPIAPESSREVSAPVDTKPPPPPSSRRAPVSFAAAPRAPASAPRAPASAPGVPAAPGSAPRVPAGPASAPRAPASSPRVPTAPGSSPRVGPVPRAPLVTETRTDRPPPRKDPRSEG